MKVTVYYFDGTSDWEIYYDIADAIQYAVDESQWRETDYCFIENGMRFRAGRLV